MSMVKTTLPGNHVARVRIYFDMADRADGVRLVVIRHLMDQFGNPCHPEPGIAALGHRRGTRMAVLCRSG